MNITSKRIEERIIEVEVVSLHFGLLKLSIWNMDKSPICLWYLLMLIGCQNVQTLNNM